MTPTEYINGLRAVADFFEQHPDLTPGFHICGDKYVCEETFNIPGRTKEELAAAAKALGHAEKKITDSHYVIHGVIGGPNLDFYNERQAICTRVLVETKVIPARVIPAREEIFVPGKVEEVYEWKCPVSLLAEGHQ